MTIRDEILAIITYHGDEGTSGYLLTPEQIDALEVLVRLSYVPDSAVESFFRRRYHFWRALFFGMAIMSLGLMGIIGFLITGGK